MVWKVLGTWCKPLSISLPFAVPLDGIGDGEECGRQVRRLQGCLGRKAGLKVQGQTHSRHLININVSLLPSPFPREFPSCGAKCYFIFWLTVGITVTLSALNIIFPGCHPISITLPLLQTPLPFLPPPFLFLMLPFYSFPVHPHCLLFYSDVTNPTRTNPIHSKRRINVP